MRKLEKYPKYKDSGVEWIGEIPKHWNMLANKYIFKLKKNLVGKKSNQYDLLSLTLKGIIKRDMENPEGKFPAEFDTYQEVKKDDFVFCLFDIEETPRTVGLSQYNGMITGAYTVMAVKNMNKRYLYYFYLNLDSNKRLKALYKGLRNTIPKDSFFAFKTFVPPKQEQIKIANYLDQKTAQIDKAISLKEQMIERLGEQRQILINDAVTKGLDKTVKMKDSGVEWIGRIPKHWEVEKGKRLFRQMKRPIKDEDEIITCFRDGEVTLRKNRRTDGFTNALKEHGYQGIRKGDLVIHNMDAFAGAIGISDSNGKSTPVYSVCIPWNEDLTLPEYYAYYLRHLAVQGFILSLAKGIRERSTDFRFNDFGELLFPVPPKVEQKEIMSYVNSITQKTQRVIALYQQQIEKLKEYKATLIDSVVTGKVRVV